MINRLIYGVLVAGLVACGLCFGGRAASDVPALPIDLVCRIPITGKDIRGVVFSPDGGKLVVFGLGEAALWDVPTGRKIADMRLLPPGEQPLGWEVVSFSWDGSRILTDVWTKGANGNFYTVWDAATGKPLGETLRLGCSVRRGRLSPDGRFLVGGMGGREDTWWIRKVNADGIAAQACLTLKGESRMEFSPDSRMAVFFHQSGHVVVYDLTEGKKLWELARNENDYAVITARFSDDSTTLFVSNGKDGPGAIYDAKGGGLIKLEEEPLQSPVLHADDVQDVTPLFGGLPFPPALVCFDGGKKEMRTLDIDLEKLQEEFRQCVGLHPDDAQNVARRRKSSPLFGGIAFVAQNGRYAVMMEHSSSQMYNYESPVVIWDVQKRQVVGQPLYWKPYIMHAFLSPGERFLCIAPGNGSPGGLILLSASAPVTVPGTLMAFSKNDSLIASREDNAVAVWRVKAHAQTTGRREE